MGGLSVSISFHDTDIKACMPHLKGVDTCIALESIQALLHSYVREAGCEIMSQLLRDEGWDIGGQMFKDSGGW